MVYHNIYHFSEAAMFGYVQPYIPNLTVGDHEYYRAAYCGLCRSMGKVCGAGANLTLSYDGVFLSLLRMLMMKDTPKCEQHRCPYSILAQKNMLVESPDIDFSAGAMGVLAALKLEDDITDESGLRKLAALLCRFPAKKWIDRADEQDLGIASNLRSKLALFYTSEHGLSETDFSDAGVDGCAEAFGEIVGMLASRGIEFENYAIAYSIGRHVGRWIYCIDAIDDLDEDVKKGRYNSFVSTYGTELDADVKLTLECLLRDESDSAMAMLDLADVDERSRAYRIVKNILTEGMPRIAHAVLEGTYRKPRREDVIKYTPKEDSL